MPHDVTMPQLGMAQDAGKIVSWLKSPGEAVSKGDALFEVETDKATMEVEAQADGFLTGVSAGEGEDVPVGAVIARISDSAEDDASAPPPAQAEDGTDDAADELPEGHAVTMPQLGMAQDSGVLVSWQKSPGDAVSADDVLFEVETDKSTMEVEAGREGFLAATLAEAGEEVPVGEAVAIISAEAPDMPLSRSRGSATAVAEPTARAPEAKTEEVPQEKPRMAPKPAPGPSGRILASPKARRLALEQGLDLARLVDAGYDQPFHASDIETLKSLPDAAPATGVTSTSRRLIAETTADGLPDFAAWCAERHGLTDADALLAGLAASSLPTPGPVTIERRGVSRTFDAPATRCLGSVAETETAAVLTLRDLRGSRLRSVEMGGEDTPVITLTSGDTGLTLTLECTPAQLDAPGALHLLTEFAGRVEQPLRHLL